MIVRLFLCCVLAFPLLSSAGEEYKVPESIPIDVDYVDTHRIKNYLLRVIKRNTESSYPCPRFQMIQPLEERIVHSVDVCSLNVVGYPAPFDIFNDLAYVGFDEFKFSETDITFRADISIRRAPRSFYAICSIKVGGHQLIKGECVPQLK